MDILVAILIIALIGAIAFIVMQRRPGGGQPVGRPAGSPLGRRGGGLRRTDPMADAVAEHARAMEPGEVVVAEQRLQAEARRVAAGLQPGMNGAAYAAPAAGAAYAAVPPTDPSLDDTFDPVTGERVDGYGDPANDPRYDDPKYDGRLAADYPAYRNESADRS